MSWIRARGLVTGARATAPWACAPGLPSRRKPATPSTPGPGLPFHSALPDAPGSKGAGDAPLPRGAILLFSHIPPPRPTPPPGHVARGCGREGPSPTSGQTGSSRLRDSDARLPPGGQVRRCGPRLASSAISCAARGTSTLRRAEGGCAGGDGEADPRQAWERLSFRVWGRRYPDTAAAETGSRFKS